MNRVGPRRVGPSKLAVGLYVVVTLAFAIASILYAIFAVVVVYQAAIGTLGYRDLALTVPQLIYGVPTLFVLWGVRSFARSMRGGDPFTTAGVRRIRILALVFLLGFPSVRLLGGILFALAFPAPHPVALVVRSMSGTALSGLISGLTLFVLAEVFAHGVRLREDVEGTV